MFCNFFRSKISDRKRINRINKIKSTQHTKTSRSELRRKLILTELYCNIDILSSAWNSDEKLVYKQKK